MKKIPLFFLPLFLLPVFISAQNVDIPKPSRPSRVTVPQTQVISSTLPDIEEEAVREASIANISSFSSNPLNSSSNYMNSFSLLNNFADSFVLPVAIGPSLAESLTYSNIGSLASLLNPPQFLLASSPAVTSLMPSNEMLRMAHSGGVQRTAATSVTGSAFWGPPFLPQLGSALGAGPTIPLPYQGSPWFQAGFPIPYSGNAFSQVIPTNSFFPAPAQINAFRGSGFYTPTPFISSLEPGLFQSAMNIFSPLAGLYPLPVNGTPLLGARPSPSGFASAHFSGFPTFQNYPFTNRTIPSILPARPNFSPVPPIMPIL